MTSESARTPAEALAAAWKIIEQGRNLARLHPMLDHLEPAEICERVYWSGLLTVITVLNEINGDAQRLKVWGDVMALIVEHGALIQSSMLDEILKLKTQPSGAGVTRQ